MSQLKSLEKMEEYFLVYGRLTLIAVGSRPSSLAGAGVPVSSISAGESILTRAAGALVHIFIWIEEKSFKHAELIEKRHGP